MAKYNERFVTGIPKLLFCMFFSFFFNTYILSCKQAGGNLQYFPILTLLYYVCIVRPSNAHLDRMRGRWYKDHVAMIGSPCKENATAGTSRSTSMPDKSLRSRSKGMVRVSASTPRFNPWTGHFIPA